MEIFKNTYTQIYIYILMYLFKLRFFVTEYLLIFMQIFFIVISIYRICIYYIPIL